MIPYILDFWLIKEHRFVYYKNRRSERVIFMLAVPKPTKKRKEPRPSRDEFELQELAESLEMAREEGKSLSFVVWRNPDPIRGTVEKMDPNTKTVHIKEQYGDVRKIPFLDILMLGRVED